MSCLLGGMLEGNFSNVFSSNKVDSSMSSKYVAFADGPKAIVLNLETCSVVRSYTCVDKIDSIQISHDSQKVLCFLKDRNIIQAFSISDKEWACRITECKSIETESRKQENFNASNYLLLS